MPRRIREVLGGSARAGVRGSLEKPLVDDVFVADGLHLNDKGNHIWAAAIKAVLMEIEAEFEMAKASGQ